MAKIQLLPMDLGLSGLDIDQELFDLDMASRSNDEIREMVSQTVQGLAPPSAEPDS